MLPSTDAVGDGSWLLGSSSGALTSCRVLSSSSSPSIKITSTSMAGAALLTPESILCFLGLLVTAAHCCARPSLASLLPVLRAAASALAAILEDLLSVLSGTVSWLLNIFAGSPLGYGKIVRFGVQVVFLCTDVTLSICMSPMHRVNSKARVHSKAFNT